MNRILTGIAILIFLANNAKAIECQADMQGGHGYWAWRLIDGRKCWYEGAPGMDKSLLHWPAQSNREADQGSHVKLEAELDESKVKQAKLAPEPAPVPTELLQMLPIMPPEPTFEDRWRLR
jgi:hypothetical protein